MGKKSSEKYPGLKKNGDIKIRHELYESEDYASKLNDAEKQWLSNFNQEYINGDFDHPGPRLHKKKMKERKIKSTGKKRKFDVGKKRITDSNNARNRCAFSVTKANRILDYSQKGIDTGTNQNRTTNKNEVEDALIMMIDRKNAKERK